MISQDVWIRAHFKILWLTEYAKSLARCAVAISLPLDLIHLQAQPSEDLERNTTQQFFFATNAKQEKNVLQQILDILVQQRSKETFGALATTRERGCCPTRLQRRSTLRWPCRNSRGWRSSRACGNTSLTQASLPHAKMCGPRRSHTTN